MRKKLLLLATFILFSFNALGQCTITGTINSSTLNCASFTSCPTIYIGDGVVSTTLNINADFDLRCLGSIQFIVRNNATVRFTSNAAFYLPSGSSLVFETGSNLTSSSCTDGNRYIMVGPIVAANCDGYPLGITTTFTELKTRGGYNVVNVVAPSICGSGTSTLTATRIPTPAFGLSTTYTWYDSSNNVVGGPSGTYTTPVLTTTTTYYVEATTAGFITTPKKAVTVVVNPVPAQPTATVTQQPTCSTATGTITITAPTAAGMTYSINGSTYTNTTGIFTGVAPGTYNVTAKNNVGCISPAISLTVNPQPITPVKPTLTATSHPTCGIATGTITIDNYDPSYTYTATPSAGVSISGNIITAPSGSYTVTATLGPCTSSNSLVAKINPQPVTPEQPTLSSVTQPTCATATGSFTITNYNASYIYIITPGVGVVRTGDVVTAPAGTYTVSAKLISCTSIASQSVTVNAQPVTPAKPILITVANPSCATATGSFTIDNYNATYTYAVTPPDGVTISGNIVTAPAGTYTVTASLGSCTSLASNPKTLSSVNTNTWNGTGWSTGSVPTGTEILVFNGNYTSTSDLAGCSCQVNSGNVVFNSGHTLTITNSVNVVGGSLTFEDGSSLVQTNNSSVNTGNIVYKRKTTPLKQYDYTYWSAPVANATLSQLATNSLFYSYDPSLSSVESQCWVNKNGTDVMTSGLGYIGRAPGNLNYATPQTVETSFTGVPNNGVINTSIKKGTVKLNLIGNPYPSAIDIDLFLTDAANSGIVNGTIYLWTHNTAISNSIPGDWTYNYTVNDYAKYNLTGATKTATAAISGGFTPTGKIAAGQGFFIEANSGLANGTYSTTFKNSMRVQGNNTQFFRNGENNNNTTGVALEKHRVWISLSNTQGGYNEALVGYIQNATNELDRLFDGKTLPSENVISIYSLLSNEKLSIQGRSLPFEATDIVPIGYTTSINGDLSINLENFDGLFANQDVYLFDKTNGQYHNLKNGSFTFTTTNGTFNDRFELRFTSSTLGTYNPNEDNAGISVITKPQHLTVLSGASNIENIEVYDLLGKLIYSKKGVNSNEFNTDAIPASAQMVIIKVSLENKKTFTKKALMP